jgi:hypothetical protein
MGDAPISDLKTQPVGLAARVHRWRRDEVAAVAAQFDSRGDTDPVMEDLSHCPARPRCGCSLTNRQRTSGHPGADAVSARPAASEACGMLSHLPSGISRSYSAGQHRAPAANPGPMPLGAQSRGRPQQARPPGSGPGTFPRAHRIDLHAELGQLAFGVCDRVTGRVRGLIYGVRSERDHSSTIGVARRLR